MVTFDLTDFADEFNRTSVNLIVDTSTNNADLISYGMTPEIVQIATDKFVATPVLIFETS
jgi:hypothetical protein